MRELLEMAEELDGMDRNVSSWEANFLQDMLNKLRAGEALTIGEDSQEAKLREIYEKYLGDSVLDPQEEIDF